MPERITSLFGRLDETTMNASVAFREHEDVVQRIKDLGVSLGFKEKDIPQLQRALLRMSLFMVEKDFARDYQAQLIADIRGKAA